MPTTSVPGAASAPELRAHLAVPAGAGPWPGVVVLHEAFGLTDDVRAHTDRLAREGYLAVAPDLFTAGGARRCLRTTFRSLFSGEGPVYGDIAAARTFLADHPDCTGRVGVVGFCMGGGFALMTASSGFAASAPNYGAVPKDLSVLDGACPVVGSYGRRDFAMRGAAAQLSAALSQRGVVQDVKEYPGVGHSFLNRHGRVATVLEKVVGMGYDEPAATDAWARILAFFGEHLGEQPAGPGR